MMLNNLELELLRLVSTGVQRRLIDLHTATPGIVERHCPQKGCVDVKIAIKRKTESGEIEQIEVVPEVPVIAPIGSESGIYYPVKPGDQVLLIFNERSIDNFKLQGGTVEPAQVPRFFDYSDAVAIPGFWHQSKFASYFTGNKVNTSMFIEHVGGFIGIDEDGKIYLGRASGTIDEPLVLGNVLLSALGDFMDKMVSLIDETKKIATEIKTGPVGIGNLGSPVPTHPTLITKLLAIEANLDLLKSNLDADKSKYISTATTNIVSQVSFTERGV